MYVTFIVRKCLKEVEENRIKVHLFSIYSLAKLHDTTNDDVFDNSKCIWCGGVDLDRIPKSLYCSYKLVDGGVLDAC